MMNNSYGRNKIIFLKLIIFIVFINSLILSAISLADDKAALTIKEKNWLKAHPLIRLAPDPQFQPIEFFNKNNQYDGIAADYFKIISERLGIKIKVVKCNSWKDVIRKIKKHDVDMLNAVVKTPQRELFLNFTSPYLKIPSVIIVRKKTEVKLNLQMLEGMHVVMVSGYGYADIIHNKFPSIQLDFVKDIKTALRKVSFGMADAFVGDLATASFYIESEGITNLKLAGESEPPNFSGFAVRKDWPELVNILEKGIALISEKEQKKINRKWFSLLAEPGIPLKKLKVAITVITSIIIAVIVFFIFWTRLLKRSVNIKTINLQKERKERKLIEASLEKSETYKKAILQIIPDLIWLKDPQGVYLACNKKFEQFVGASESDIIGKTDFDFNDKKTAESFLYHDRKAMNEGASLINEEKIVYADDGHEEILETIKTPLYGNDGKLIGVLSIARDITDRKIAEEERLKLQQQLIQAQKMESIGRLAGGVAHDFNNMLSIIMGYSEMVLDSIEPLDPLHESFTEIMNAAQRSSDIVKQLLTFARKQSISPKIININDAFPKMIKMLRRLIGENIELIWKPGDNLWNIRIDDSQLNQILTNLATNAKHSIKDVGKLVIKTTNIHSDSDFCLKKTGCMLEDYVMLSVNDTGCGMNKETVENIFEPFFTTKIVGEGTGLGLSTIYGIVKQNGGFIDVHSEPEKGTTFEIYFPRCDIKQDENQLNDTKESSLTGDETILIVEDEKGLLKLEEELLKRLGYNVLSAKNPVDAINTSNSFNGQIDILITDIIMPAMNGLNLSKKLKKTRPNLKSLFLSGYTADVIYHHGISMEEIHFVKKPFSKENFALKIREILDDK